jgi:hypothetical protein
MVHFKIDTYTTIARGKLGMQTQLVASHPHSLSYIPSGQRGSQSAQILQNTRRQHGADEENRHWSVAFIKIYKLVVAMTSVTAEGYLCQHLRQTYSMPKFNRNQISVSFRRPFCLISSIPPPLSYLPPLILLLIFSLFP